MFNPLNWSFEVVWTDIYSVAAFVCCVSIVLTYTIGLFLLDERYGPVKHETDIAAVVDDVWTAMHNVEEKGLYATGENIASVGGGSEQRLQSACVGNSAAARFSAHLHRLGGTLGVDSVHVGLVLQNGVWLACSLTRTAASARRWR